MDRAQENWLRYGLFGILLAQSFVYGLRLRDGFYDGNQHLSWSTPFYLMKGQEMHQVPFWTKGVAGFVSKSVPTANGRLPVEWYASHPQLLAIPIYLWTGLFGYDEWVGRSLPILATFLTTILLWLGVRERHDARLATIFAGAWAALPAVVVYGRSLEHEPLVMLFASLALLAHEKFAAGGARWRWAWFAALIVMMWSDWSGFVFAGVLFAAQVGLSLWHRPTRRLALLTALSIVAALVIVLTQLILTKTPPPAGVAAPAGIVTNVGMGVGSLWNQYYNRSGLAGGAPWGYWRLKQALYWSTNFGSIIGLLGLLAGLASLLAVGGRDLQDNGLSVRAILFLIAFGNLIYAVIVREATAVHLFYQYYYGAFVAWGLAEIVEWVRRAAIRAGRPPALALVAWAAMLATLSVGAVRTLYTREWSGPGEVALLKLMKTYPPESTAVMIASPEDNYLANPSGEYYTGQRIWMAYPEDAVMKDLVLLAPGDLDSQQAALNMLAAPKSKFQLRACSTLLCLWVRTKA